MQRPQIGNCQKKLATLSGASGFAISGRRSPSSRKLVNSQKLKAIIRMSASVGATPRFLCRPRKSKDYMRTTSTSLTEEANGQLVSTGKRLDDGIDISQSALHYAHIERIAGDFFKLWVVNGNPLG